MKNPSICTHNSDDESEAQSTHGSDNECKAHRISQLHASSELLSTYTTKLLIQEIITNVSLSLAPLIALYYYASPSKGLCQGFSTFSTSVMPLYTMECDLEKNFASILLCQKLL